MVVVATTWSDLVFLLSSPVSALVSSSSSFPLSFVNAIHAYHLLAFRPLRQDEVWHHLVFLPTCGLSGAVFEWGAVGNYLAFFICGLPGGVTYALLSAQRCGFLLFVDEPSVTAWLNMYVRLPGILSSSTLLLVGVREGWTLVPLPVVLVQLFLSVWNGLKYAEEAVARRTERRGQSRKVT